MQINLIDEEPHLLDVNKLLAVDKILQYINILYEIEDFDEIEKQFLLLDKYKTTSDNIINASIYLEYASFLQRVGQHDKSNVYLEKIELLAPLLTKDDGYKQMKSMYLYHKASLIDNPESKEWEEAEKYLTIFKEHPYVFNLGHGILPETKIDLVKELIHIVRNYK